MQETSQNSEQPKKKILIDTTFLFDQYSFRGIGKYGKEVVKRLLDYAVEDNFEVWFAGFHDLKKNLIALGLSQFGVDQHLKHVQFYSFGEPVNSSLGNIKRWKDTFKLAIEEIKPDIYYSANFERGLPTTWILKRNVNYVPKTVVMAHDAIPIATRSYSQKSIVHNVIKGVFYNIMFNGVKNADLVLTNSNFSKGDLIKYGKIPETKIRPIYLGVDEKFFEKSSEADIKHVMKAFSLEPQKYFIYDSGLEKNKGVDDLIEIFKKLIQLNPEFPSKLVLVGKDFNKAKGSKIQPQNERADKVLKKLKTVGILDYIITTDRVSDEDLTILIQEAYCYFNFSKYEGFSFGPLQAMAAKVPAIVGNYSCIPEVTDGGAFLINSSNASSAAQLINEYLTNTDQVQEFIKKGYEVVSRYSWETTVEQTWNEIKQLV